MKFQILSVSPLFSIRNELVNYIHIFGRTKEGKSVSLYIQKVPSYFYIPYVEASESKMVRKLEEELKKELDPKKCYESSNGQPPRWYSSAYCRKFACNHPDCPSKWKKKNKKLERAPNYEPCIASQIKKSKNGMIELGELVYAKAFEVYSAQPQKFRQILLRFPFWRYRVRKKLEQRGIQCFESHVDHVIRFMNDCGLTGGGWVSVDDAHLLLPKKKNSRCELDYLTDVAHIKSESDDSCAPLQILSFDIECISESGEFPNANKLGDLIIQISALRLNYGEDIREAKVMLNKQFVK